MKKLLPFLFAIALAACTTDGTNTENYEGYEISGPITGYSSAAIQIRQVELINALRAEQGLSPVQISAQLTAAALTHAKDIARQQRAWNYGSDRSTPQTRGTRAGFSGIVTGELVAETYIGELGVLRAWGNNSLSRAVILSPSANQVGVAYFMEASGKVWWVTDFGQAGATQTRSSIPAEAADIIIIQQITQSFVDKNTAIFSGVFLWLYINQCTYTD